MKKNDYQKSNEDIAVLLGTAKVRQGIKDAELGSRIDVAQSTIRNMKSQKTLPNLPYWKVLMIADMAGYRIRMEEKNAL